MWPKKLYACLLCCSYVVFTVMVKLTDFFLSFFCHWSTASGQYHCSKVHIKARFFFFEIGTKWGVQTRNGRRPWLRCKPRLSRLRAQPYTTAHAITQFSIYLILKVIFHFTHIWSWSLLLSQQEDLVRFFLSPLLTFLEANWRGSNLATKILCAPGDLNYEQWLKVMDMLSINGF